MSGHFRMETEITMQESQSQIFSRCTILKYNVLNAIYKVNNKQQLVLLVSGIHMVLLAQC